MAYEIDNLPDCCARPLAYIDWVCRQDESASVDEVRYRFEELFREFDEHGQRAGYEVPHVRLAIFALVAYADERILTSQWPGKGPWLEKPLQLAFFDVNAAGEEFFLRLEQLKNEGGNQGRIADVMECFAFCLRLGFRGRFGPSPSERKQLDEITRELDADILRRRGGERELFLQRGADVERPYDREEPLPAWLVPCCAIAAVLLVYLILLGLLDVRSGHLADQLAGIM